MAKTIEKYLDNYNRLSEDINLSYGELAWKLGEIMMAMNDEDAYYESGWLYLWPDGETKEQCMRDFDTKEAYEELWELFKDIYSDPEYHNNGLFTSEKRIVDYAHQIDKKLGLPPIKNYMDDIDDNLTETYSEKELDDMIGKVYNIQKITNIYRRKKYGERRLFAHTVCTKCGRTKTVFLSNLVNDPDKYGSCVCSDTNIEAKIANIQQLYDGSKKLKNNTSGYTGVSFVKTYKGQPYNKWRAYIEIDGVRNYLGDFTSKAEAIKARKEAGEKGIKWYKDNRNRLMRDLRRKSKKYTTSKYRETQKTKRYTKTK